MLLLSPWQCIHNLSPACLALCSNIKCSGTILLILATLVILASSLCRWKGDNGPEQTDSIATGNLIRATPKSIERFVYNTSAGVERYNKLPFSILNLFGKILAQ